MFLWSSQKPGTIPRCLHNDVGLPRSIHVDTQIWCYSLGRVFGFEYVWGLCASKESGEVDNEYQIDRILPVMLSEALISDITGLIHIRMRNFYYYEIRYEKEGLAPSACITKTKGNIKFERCLQTKTISGINSTVCQQFKVRRR